MLRDFDTVSENKFDYHNCIENRNSGSNKIMASIKETVRFCKLDHLQIRSYHCTCTFFQNLEVSMYPLAT